MLGPHRRTTLLLLAAILAAHALLWWLRPFAFLDELDSQHYARISAEIVAGRFTPVAHPFYDRIGVTAPTAALYRAFGIGARATTLWPLLCSLLTIAVVFAAAARTFGSRTGLLAGFLLAANPIQVHYAAHLLPDLIGSGFMVGAVALLYQARDRRTGTAARVWLEGGLCVLTLIAALLVKKTVVWAVLFFAGVMAWDLVRRRNVRLWMAIVATGLALSGLFCFSYYLATGNPLHVLASIETTHNVSPLASFAGRSAAEYLHRLSLGPVRLFVDQLGYGYLLVLAVPALLELVRPLRPAPRGVRFWASYVAVVLLCFWFGTTSLHAYNPLPVSPRFPMPALAPLAILAAVALTWFWTDRERTKRRLARALPIAAAFGAAGAAWLASLPLQATVYLALGLAVLLVESRPRNPLHRLTAKIAWTAIAVALPLGILAAYVDRGGIKLPNPLRVKQQEFVRRHLGSLPSDAVVLTDAHSAFVLPFLLRRVGARLPTIIDWGDEAAVAARAGAPALVFVDQTTLSMTREWFGWPTPWFGRQPPSRWHLVARLSTRWHGSGPGRDDPGSPRAKILLFEVDDATELLQAGGDGASTVPPSP